MIYTSIYIEVIELKKKKKKKKDELSKRYQQSNTIASRSSFMAGG